MRKVLLPLAAAVSALTIAVPASAQWAPPVYRYAPYNFGYGFNGFAFARAMDSRLVRIRGDIRALQMHGLLSFGQARALDIEARNLQGRIFRASRFGINPYEARSIENGIRRLEFRVSRAASRWHRPVVYRRY